MRWIAKLEYLETCAIDYLADHHNREGELLIGVAFNPSDTESQVGAAVRNAAEMTDAYDDAFPAFAFDDAFAASDDFQSPCALFWTHGDDSDPAGLDDDESDVQHWFLFTYVSSADPVAPKPYNGADVCPSIRHDPPLREIKEGDVFYRSLNVRSSSALFQAAPASGVYVKSRGELYGPFTTAHDGFRVKAILDMQAAQTPATYKAAKIRAFNRLQPWAGLGA